MLRDVFGRLTEWGTGQLRLSPAAPAGLVAVAIIVYWSIRDGATDPLVLVPSSLLLVGLLVVVAWTAPGSMPGGTAGAVALLAFAGYVVWCFLSILWSDVEADAWSGANQTLVYFVVYALFAIRPWQASAAQAILGTYSFAIAAVGTWVLLRLDDPDRQVASFINGRLAEPISYVNANCALFAAAVLPAAYLASRKETPVILRGLLLAAAGTLAQLAILCQSRMSLVALPIVVVIYLAIVPGRLRSLLGLLLVAGAVTTSLSALLDVYEAEEAGGGILASIVDAQRAVLLSATALAFVGVAWGLIDRRLELPSRLVRAVGIATIVLISCLGIASMALLADRYGNPRDDVADAWEQFKGDDFSSQEGQPHLVSSLAGAGRYDIWKVALDVFARNPVAGVGVDNFGVDWLRERPNQRDLVSPHSVELRVLQQTGLVGAFLLATFLGGVLVAAWGVLRATDERTRGTAAVALLLFGYWVLHGSIDWLWEVPALSAAAFASLGLVVALSPRDRGDAARPWLVPGALSVVGLFALLTLVPPWLSAREVETALASLRADPEAAYVHLDRARSLNPLSDEPDVLGAVIAAGRGDPGRQRTFLLRAVQRNPYNWYSYLELGLIDARRNERKSSMSWLNRAVDLNPRDATIQFVVERVRAGRPPGRAELEARIASTADLCCRP